MEYEPVIRPRNIAAPREFKTKWEPEIASKKLKRNAIMRDRASKRGPTLCGPKDFEEDYYDESWDAACHITCMDTFRCNIVFQNEVYEFCWINL